MKDEVISKSLWMTNLPEELTKQPINKLAVPGSHNSGAFYLDPTTPISPDKSKFIKTVGNCNKNAVINWSLCQSCSIREQLENGVRYFDMRPGYIDYEDDFFFVHGVHGLRISDLLCSMREFLLEHPREVIIIDFNHFHKFTSSLHGRFLKIIMDIFAEMLYPHKHADDFSIGFSLHDMWHSSKQVFLSYKELSICQNNREFWYSRCLHSPWFNTAHTPHLITQRNHLQKNLKADHFNVFQAILTARKSTVALNPTSTLRDCLARRCNESVEEWLKDKQKEYGINVVMCDFICDGMLIDLILKLNWKGLRSPFEC